MEQFQKVTHQYEHRHCLQLSSKFYRNNKLHSALRAVSVCVICTHQQLTKNVCVPIWKPGCGPALPINPESESYPLYHFRDEYFIPPPEP